MPNYNYMCSISFNNAEIELFGNTFGNTGCTPTMPNYMYMWNISLNNAPLELFGNTLGTQDTPQLCPSIFTRAAYALPRTSQALLGPPGPTAQRPNCLGPLRKPLEASRDYISLKSTPPFKFQRHVGLWFPTKMKSVLHF